MLHTLTHFIRRPQYFVSDDEEDEKRVVRSQKDKRSAVHVGNSCAHMQGIVGDSYKNSVIFQFGGGTSLIPRLHSSSSWRGVWEWMESGNEARINHISVLVCTCTRTWWLGVLLWGGAVNLFWVWRCSLTPPKLSICTDMMSWRISFEWCETARRSRILLKY